MGMVTYRKSIAAAVMVALLVVVAGCGGGEDSGGSSTVSTQTEQSATVTPPSELVHAGKLTLGTDFTYPPYESIEGSEKVGFDVELAAQLAAAMGLEPEMVDTRFSSLIPGLDANRFDAIESALYITAERAKQVDYIPYFTTGNALVVKASSEYQPAEPEELCGHTVAVLQGSDVEGRVQSEVAPACEEELELKSFPTDTEAFQEVAAGRAEVLLTDRGVATDRINSLPQLEMKISSPKVIWPVPVGLAVRKGDTEMKQALEEALAAVEKSGTFKKLLDKYGLKPVEPKLVEEALSEEG